MRRPNLAGGFPLTFYRSAIHQIESEDSHVRLSDYEGVGFLSIIDGDVLNLYN